jgi:hypothetical protein
VSLAVLTFTSSRLARRSLGSASSRLRAVGRRVRGRKAELCRACAQRARSYLSLQNFKYAQYYLHSTQHDLRAMREVLERAARVLSSQLVCPEN